MSHFRYIKYSYYLLVLILLISCKQKDNTITIKGNIKGLNAKWVYLYECFRINPKPVDSARVIDNKFEFNFHPDTTFQPYAGYIAYRTKPAYKGMLGIINPITSTSKKLDLYASLYIEPGVINLTGDLTKSNGITLTGGEQNDFYFRNNDLPFIYISKDPTKKRLQISKLIKLIKDNPNAYYAMFALGNLKFYLSNNELKSIYDEFDDEVKKAYNGRKINEFLNTRPDENALKPNAFLTDTNKKQIGLIDTAKKLNMIVFWASWCGPCKEEIPSLKKIAAEFKDPNFRMVSVSIDKDKKKWKQTVANQNMAWQQLVIENTDLERLTAQYNLNSIPQIYFIDNNRRMISHIGGYSLTNEAVIEKTIAAALK
ncbi:Thiol-disulfide isomerase or thioredoxin [Mucilaginibacter mallensis]|uniref:Thiol-disulfide isomerase or thioredoxin n=1 Tax=Mucilaginibacter mallensis TaxID=652787 RepID=A0A1H1RBW0_MUCMA|nr:AhpC/TSA family protein [Mucilaginibacter mallensis]SDS33277.1 Thiol-disulfide isomerase or thioredoxin [Mucilaginibacter mallensis]